MTEIAALARAYTRARAGEEDVFRAGIAACTGAVAAFGIALGSAWPPHEDEALALFVGRGSLPEVLRTVVLERGGAPLHFVLAWAIVHLGGGLEALRLLSTAFAAGSVPLVALLGRRLAGSGLAGLLACVLAAGSWVFLFDAVFGRMYSLFLFTSTLSFLTLLSALERRGRRRHALWGLTLLAMLASHPYGVLVLVAQALFVAALRRREALATIAAVAVVAAPLWWADLVLRGRFDVGLGGQRPSLPVARYLWATAADFSSGFVRPLAVALAAAGLVLLARRRRDGALLAALVVAVPAAALLVVRIDASASPETRHLVFALPFFALLVAMPLAELAPVAATAAAVAVVGAGLGWAYQRTPELFRGDPAPRVEAREDAAVWLARTVRRGDVVFGYAPVYLVAWERHRTLPTPVPRADPRLLARALAERPLRHGVWVLDAGAATNAERRTKIPAASPGPGLETRTFGPYLVVRSRSVERSARVFLADSERVMRLARRLHLGDAHPNLRAIRGALRSVR